MTFEDIKNYFLTSYNFQKKTGIAHNNFLNWKKKGFVPIKTQIKLQKITNGELKASLEHLNEEI